MAAPACAMPCVLRETPRTGTPGKKTDLDASEKLDVWGVFRRYARKDGCIGKLGRLEYALVIPPSPGFSVDCPSMLNTTDPVLFHTP